MHPYPPVPRRLIAVTPRALARVSFLIKPLPVHRQLRTFA
jgi:hypothetical protein